MNPKTLALLLFLSLPGRSFSQTEDLWEAVKNNDLPQAQQAIRAGAEVNAQDENGAPVLWWATLKGDLDLVKYLISQQADYQPKQGTISCGEGCFYGNLTGIAAGENKLEVLKYFVEVLEIPVDDKAWYPEYTCFCGRTALQWALKKEHDLITKYLSKKGAHLNNVDRIYSDERIDLLKALKEFKNREYIRYTSLEEALNKPLEVFHLDLSGQELTSFPIEILKLKNLKILNIGYNDSTGKGNYIKALPPEIGNLTNLTDIDLDTNQLKVLPPEIGNLKNLTGLHLGGNQLKVLPSEIRNLTNLTGLYLGGNQLRELLPEIGNLTQLYGLGLSDNQLTDMPPEIGNLKYLNGLYLSGNQLTSLPPENGNLTQLYGLGLSDNR